MKPIIAAIALPSLLATTLVGCAVDDAQTGEAAQATSGTPSTCAEIAAATPSAQDGDYMLYISHEPAYRWLAYCADMKSSPKEYLSLPDGPGLNTSMYSNGNKRVVTVYEKVRIDPRSLAVDLTDQRFATSTGTANVNGTTITSVPFGVAMSCNGAQVSSNVSFPSPFRLEQPFSLFGTDASGHGDFSADRQSNTTTLTGNCGWVAPSKDTDPTDDSSQQELYLAFFLP